MKTGLTVGKKPCSGCVRSSHGTHCAWWTTDKCKLLSGKLKPTMYEVPNSERPKRFSAKIFKEIQRQISCDCGRIFTTSNWDSDAILNCPDCGFSSTVTA
jgi:hypothetical protein